MSGPPLHGGEGWGAGILGWTYGHGQQTGLVVLQLEVLVGELLGAVDAGRTGAVAVEEVAALAHEAGNLAVC